MVIAQQPFCWKWISVTKISKYGKKWIFTSIERELHVSTPYGFLIMWHPFLILSLFSIIHFTWSDYYPPLPYSLSTLPWKTAMPKAINGNRKKSYDLLTVNWNAQSRDTIEVAPVLKRWIALSTGWKAIHWITQLVSQVLIRRIAVSNVWTTGACRINTKGKNFRIIF